MARSQVWESDLVVDEMDRSVAPGVITTDVTVIILLLWLSSLSGVTL